MPWLGNNDSSHHEEFQLGYVRGRIESLEEKFDKHVQRTYAKMDHSDKKIEELNDKIDNIDKELKESIRLNSSKLSNAESILRFCQWLLGGLAFILTAVLAYFTSK